MLTGTVVKFDVINGSGFITPDDDASIEIYVIEAGIVGDGIKTLLPGHRVTFEVETHVTYRSAKHVCILS